MAPEDLFFDPVCGRHVEPSRAEAAEVQHRKVYFCSARCRARFAARTERERVDALARMGALLARPPIRWGLA